MRVGGGGALRPYSEAPRTPSPPPVRRYVEFYRPDYRLHLDPAREEEGSEGRAVWQPAPHAFKLPPCPPACSR